MSVATEPPQPADASVTPVFFVVEPRAEQLAELVRLAASGQLRVAIDSTFPLAGARAAFERVQQPGKRGKVVLVVRDA